DGEAEIGIIVIPNILSVPGAELVGPLPPELQSYITFTAAISAQSPHQQAAADLIKLITSPSGVDVIKSKGMEPGWGGGDEGFFRCVGWAKARARSQRVGKIVRAPCPRGDRAGDFAHPTQLRCLSQRALDCQKISPSEPFLQRRTQQIGG